MYFHIAQLLKLLSFTQLKWTKKTLFKSLILQKLSHTLSDFCDTTWESYPTQMAYVPFTDQIISNGWPLIANPGVPIFCPPEASEKLLNHAQNLFFDLFLWCYSFGASIHIWWEHQISYVLCEIRNNVNKKGDAQCTSFFKDHQLKSLSRISIGHISHLVATALFHTVPSPGGPRQDPSVPGPQQGHRLWRFRPLGILQHPACRPGPAPLGRTLMTLT